MFRDIHLFFSLAGLRTDLSRTSSGILVTQKFNFAEKRGIEIDWHKLRDVNLNKGFF